MKQRVINQILPAQLHGDSELKLYRALPQRVRRSIGPYVFVDHYQHHNERGIGDRPHPHAGIEVISYLLRGSSTHYDSFGFSDTLEAFDTQYICAGRGIIHKEIPDVHGRHGLQLWTSLPASEKMREPHYSKHHKKDIPEFQQNDGTVRLISGSLNGYRGVLNTVTPNLFVHVHLPKNGEITLNIGKENAEELGLYVAQGELDLGNGEILGEGRIAIFNDDGEQITLHATAANAVDLVLIGGEKVHDPLIFDGPFVMDTPERIEQAYRDYHSGKMGKLQ